LPDDDVDTDATAQLLELEGGGSDMAAALDAARPNQTLIMLAQNRHALVVRRNDTVVEDVDLTPFLPRPPRATGNLRVATAEGFIAAMRDRADGEPTNHSVVYICRSSPPESPDGWLVGVLNDHGPEGPGWRDHRVSLNLAELHFTKAVESVRAELDGVVFIEGVPD